MFTILQVFGSWLARSPFISKLIDVVGPALRWILLAAFAIGVIYLCFLNIKTTYDAGVSAKTELSAAKTRITELEKKVKLAESAASRAQDAVIAQCEEDRKIDQKAENAKRELERRFPGYVPAPYTHYVPPSPAAASKAQPPASSSSSAAQSFWVMQELSNQFCSADKTYCGPSK